MSALFAGLTTLDVLHAVDHTPDPTVKITSTDFLLAAGGPATNAAVTHAALERLAREETPGRVLLLTALGHGHLAQVITHDLAESDVTILDATAPSKSGHSDQVPSEAVPAHPAVSSILDHPSGRMVASTNARIPTSPQRAHTLLSDYPADAIDVILVDGHNPELAHEALTLHHPDQAADASNPSDLNRELARLNANTDHHGAPRVLDGGSWKPWLLPLLANIDIAVISADFVPPLCAGMDTDTPEFEAATIDFLRGCGIRRVIRTRGSRDVHWWWDGLHGSQPVPQVEAISTLGAGDIFHGAFTWALARTLTAHRATPDLPSRPTLGDSAPNPSGLIAFASTVAAISTTHFGTRSWARDPQVADAVRDFLASLRTAVPQTCASQVSALQTSAGQSAAPQTSASQASAPQTSAAETPGETSPND